MRKVELIGEVGTCRSFPQRSGQIEKGTNRRIKPVECGIRRPFLVVGIAEVLSSVKQFCGLAVHSLVFPIVESKLTEMANQQKKDKGM